MPLGSTIFQTLRTSWRNSRRNSRSYKDQENEQSLCAPCSGLTLASAANDLGYRHVKDILELHSNSQWCDLCGLIQRAVILQHGLDIEKVLSKSQTWKSASNKKGVVKLMLRDRENSGLLAVEVEGYGTLARLQCLRDQCNIRLFYCFPLHDLAVSMPIALANVQKHIRIWRVPNSR
jgi:hypothetical protein